MSHDARGMLEVNRELLRPAALQSSEACPLVVSAATWGRGCRQDVLQAMEPFRHQWGYNSSLVAAPPRALAAELLKLPDLLEVQPPGPGRFQALGMAYGQVHAEWLSLDETDDGELF